MIGDNGITLFGSRDMDIVPKYELVQGGVGDTTLYLDEILEQ